MNGYIEVPHILDKLWRHFSAALLFLLLHQDQVSVFFSCYPWALGDIVCQGRAIGHDQIPIVQDEQEVIAIDVAYLIRPPHLGYLSFS